MMAMKLSVIDMGNRIYVTGRMRKQLVCNDPRVVATTLKELFVCNVPRVVTN